MATVDVIIPALDEERSIGRVIDDIPGDLVRNILVVDNGSKDGTASVARQKGAIVIDQPRKGYGNACLRAMRFIEESGNPPDLILFIDGDYSDYPEESGQLIQPIILNEYDFVVGSRTLGQSQRGSITPQQIFGNWLATRLINTFFGGNFTDLGPFRAISWKALDSLKMQDRNYGWTIEMQIKALKRGLRIKEVPVSYRNRIGKSKVSGTLKGSILAGQKILYTIFKYSFT